MRLTRLVMTTMTMYVRMYAVPLSRRSGILDNGMRMSAARPMRMHTKRIEADSLNSVKTWRQIHARRSVTSRRSVDKEHIVG